jgi:predicted porin
MEYGILLSMSYNNLKLESGFSTGKMNWKLNYSELPVLTDSILTMEITQEEVWTINQITDTSGMVVHTDSVLSHTYSDTSYKTQYTTSNPPTERGNISISYYQIPFQIGYEFHFKRHRIQPYLGASLLLPYKSSGIIRKEKYELDDFNSKYSINKSLINYSIGIRYSYDLTKRTGIYTSVNFRSSNEYLFSHDEINFKTNQISIRAGIRYKLF